MMPVPGNADAPGICALIPAAGYSARMRRFKPLLPMGDVPMIRAAIDLFHRAGIPDIIVVTGHHHDRLAPVVTDAGARAVFNPDHDAGMFSSICAGVAALPADCRGFFLLPADIPAVRPATPGLILKAFINDSSCPVIPEFNGTPGHPPLIPARLIPAIQTAGPDTRLRQILFSGTVKKRSVHDRGILMDADTPDAYEAALAKYRCRHIPDREECLSIINHELDGDTDIRAHLFLVEKTAMALCRALVRFLPGLDPDLVRAGALLHDIKRRQTHHALAGKRFLAGLGFPGVADIVGSHMTLDAPEPDPGEREIVFFADKLCRNHILDLDYPTVFRQKALDFPHAGQRIMQRLETAQYIHARIESIIGRPLREILG
ncbi:MAG: DVU_1551 family NTP transferase [Desulfobacter sp.]